MSIIIEKVQDTILKSLAELKPGELFIVQDNPEDAVFMLISVELNCPKDCVPFVDLTTGAVSTLLASEMVKPVTAKMQYAL